MVLVLAAPAASQNQPSPPAAADRLRPPTDDPYADPIDWNALPPWRQTAFFGLRARGQVFVFVVDCSGSMADDARLARAKAELRRCINNLRWPQRYHVIFFNNRPRAFPGGPAPADAASKSRLAAWLRLIDADGDTDPRAAMAQALALQPDAVFLLSDGLFPEGAVPAIAQANTRNVPIHCIDLAGGDAGAHLRQIARDSRGQYASRP